MTTSDAYFVGVDVGSRSVRSMLISEKGEFVDLSTCPIDVFNPKKDFYEQSSEQIWRAVCHTVQKITKNVDKSSVKGIGFDATCSLVVLDSNGLPVSLTDDHEDTKDTGKDVQNIIMWMDHRAKSEADFINSTNHKVLQYVGGTMSLEMEIPKVLWIYNNIPGTWKKAHHFFDLPDFLTFKATGKLSRSLCSVVCKWTYMNNDDYKGWDKDFFDKIGLNELSDNNFSKIGSTVLAPGDFVGGLSDEAANDLGLEVGTSVGGSLVDAHAGSLAMVTAGIKQDSSVIGRLAMICGTSTCHMLLSKEPIFIPGVWGPFLSNIVPGFWSNSGGQSAVGSLIDHVIFNHSAIKFLDRSRSDVYGWLEEILENMLPEKTRGIDDITYLTNDVHVYPDFHGNRSPLADPSMTGMITGLTLESGKEDLALLYLSTLQALSYSTKHIIDKLQEYGHSINTVLLCGGLTKSQLFVQTTADVLGLPVCIPHVKESVVLGAAMLGATASKHFGSSCTLEQVAKKLAGQVDTFQPSERVRKDRCTPRHFYRGAIRSDGYDVHYKRFNKEEILLNTTIIAKERDANNLRILEALYIKEKRPSINLKDEVLSASTI